MNEQLLEKMMTAMSRGLVDSATALTVDQMIGWVKRAYDGLPKGDGLASSQVRKIAEKIASDQPAGPLGDEINSKKLARWFEVPEEEFGSTKKEQLEPEILVRHIYLENLFSDWLDDWGYQDISRGIDLEGLEDIEYNPDVYGRLYTVHGEFEICINFVCDDPPSINRVRALMETIEAYANPSYARNTFAEGDVFVIATPFRFGKNAASSIRLQNKQEKYTVVRLEGDDLFGLKALKDPGIRLKRMMEIVKKSKSESAEGIRE